MFSNIPNRNNNKKRILILCLLIAPAIFHAVGFTFTATGQEIGRIDIAVFLAVMGYLCASLYVSHSPKLTGRFLLLTYTSVCSLIVMDIALSFAFPPPPERIPIVPIVRKGIAADTMPGISGPIVYSVNNLGIRGPQEKMKNAKLRILCIGGSTTECLYVTDEKSWPWVVQNKLTKDLGIEVFVGNAGKSGHIAIHHAYMIRHFELVDQFDWVVVLCGINDRGCLLNHNYEQRKKLIAEESLTESSLNTAYYRRLSMFRLLKQWHNSRVNENFVKQDFNGLWYADRRRLRQKRLRLHALTTVPEGCAEALVQYRKDLEDIISACRERKVNLVFMTQPTLYKENIEPELDALMIISCDEGAHTIPVLTDLMKRYNDVMRQTCQEENIPLIDLVPALSQDTSTFYDDCHFNISGCEKVAVVVADFFKLQVNP